MNWGAVSKDSYDMNILHGRFAAVLCNRDIIHIKIWQGIN